MARTLLILLALALVATVYAVSQILSPLLAQDVFSCKARNKDLRFECQNLAIGLWIAL